MTAIRDMDLARRERPTGRSRFGLAVPVVIAALVLPSCGDPMEQLQDDLGTFPVPSHLVQIQKEE